MAFFVNKIERIKENLDAQTQDPLLKLRAVIGKWQKCGQIKSFSFRPIDMNVVQKIIKRMNRSGAECSLGLSNNIVKMSHTAITHPMIHLTNRIIARQLYPNKWKLARVLALWWSMGIREDISNYRPISLLSPLSKVFERFIHFQINQHMEKNRLWNKDMNAYKENHSTTRALIDMTER